MSLTPKQKAFVEEYLQCYNATEAARRAGYKGSDNVLGVTGFRLLRNPKIAERIAKRFQARVMSADEVLARLSEMARSDVSEFINEHGVIDWEAVKAKGYLVKRIAHHKGQKSTIELYDAKDALALVGKRHALFSDTNKNLNIDLSILSAEQLERIANGEDPIHVLATSGEGGTGET